MTKVVPATPPTINLLDRQPGEPVVFRDYGTVIDTQTYLYSKAGTRIVGIPFDPELVLTAGYVNLGWWDIRAIRPQGPDSYFYMLKVNGFNFDLRARFYYSAGSFTEAILTRPPIDPPGYSELEIQVAQPGVDSYRLQLEARADDTGGPSSHLADINLVAAPLDPSRPW